MAKRKSSRQAERPSEFRTPAWSDIARRTWGEVGKDRLSLVASGVAFYIFLALFPAIAAVVSLYGMVADPASIEQAVSSLRGVLPAEVTNIITRQMETIAANSGAALGVGAIIGTIIALWSATKGTKALIEALNIAYEETEARGFFRLNAVALLLTLGAMLAFIIAAVFVVAVPALIDRLTLPQAVRTTVDWARWPLLALGMMVALAALYRYGPSRRAPRWQWVSVGAIGATLLWLGASALFSLYVSQSGSYNETYGSLAAIVILLMWFYISVFVVLMGAELNSEMEHQTARDTTAGAPRAMGEREAQMADTVAGGEHETESRPRRAAGGRRSTDTASGWPGWRRGFNTTAIAYGVVVAAKRRLWGRADHSSHE